MRKGNGIVQELRFIVGMMLCGAMANLAMQTDSLGQASQVTYTVDPTQSVITACGTYLGEPLDTTIFGSTENPVISSGFIDNYSGTINGTINANRDFSANTIMVTAAKSGQR